MQGLMTLVFFFVCAFSVMRYTDEEKKKFAFFVVAAVSIIISLKNWITQTLKDLGRIVYKLEYIAKTLYNNQGAVVKAQTVMGDLTLYHHLHNIVNK